MKRLTSVILAAVPFLFFMMFQMASAGEGRTVRLPEPRMKGKVSVERAIYEREAVRDFRNTPVRLSDLSQILWAAGGGTIDGITGPTRAYPSAGGVYPLDIYVVAGDVTGLSPGVYRYLWRSNELENLRTGDMRSRLAKACMGQDMMAEAPFTIVVFAHPDRVAKRYGERGRTKYLSMDAGHMGQNVHLQAEALGLGTVMVGAFTETGVKRALGVKRGQPIYVMPVGYSR
jgi:SagB-type dehydrogenase family enzyme